MGLGPKFVQSAFVRSYPEIYFVNNVDFFTGLFAKVSQINNFRKTSSKED